MLKAARAARRSRDALEAATARPRARGRARRARRRDRRRASSTATPSSSGRRGAGRVRAEGALPADRAPRRPRAGAARRRPSASTTSRSSTSTTARSCSSGTCSPATRGGSSRAARGPARARGPRVPRALGELRGRRGPAPAASLSAAAELVAGPIDLSGPPRRAPRRGPPERAWQRGIVRRATSVERWRARRCCANVGAIMAEQSQLPEPDVAREWLRHDDAHPPLRGARRRDVRARPRSAASCTSRSARRRRSSAPARAMRDDDYLISTYRSHGHALARGTRPDARHGRAVRARRRRARNGRGGSMHMFDLERRFMGGYGIVGGNLPIAAGIGAGLRLPRHRGRDALHRSATAPPTRARSARRMNLAALWKLPVVFMVTNNQFGMGTALERHSAVTDLQAQGRGLRRAGHELRRHGRARHLPRQSARRCASRARSAGRCCVEAITYRFRGHSMADPEEYRTKEQVEEWRKRDPIVHFGDRLEAEGVLERRRARASSTRRRSRASTSAVAFADDSPLPAAGVALRRRLRARRPGARLVLGRRALGRRAQGRGRARCSREQPAARARRRVRRPATCRSS